MNASHWGRVVIDKTNASGGVAAVNRDFLCEFSKHSRFVRRIVAVLAVGACNMTTNADRSLCAEACLALTSAARIGKKERGPIGVAPRKHTIGNQLFERWVLFHARPWPPTRMLPI
jgi:hypothetical protein